MSLAKKDIDNSNILLPGIVKVLLKNKTKVVTLNNFTVVLCFFRIGLSGNDVLDRVEFVDLDEISWTQQQGSRKKLFLWSKIDQCQLNTLTEANQYCGQVPFANVHRELIFILRESHGLQGYNSNQSNFTSSHEVCSAMRVVELSTLAIRKAIAVQLRHISHCLQQRVCLVGTEGVLSKQRDISLIRSSNCSQGHKITLAF